VLVTVLSTAEGGLAGAGLIATVNAALSADDVRPFTDQVIVQSAAVTNYNIVAALSIAPGPDPATVTAAAATAAQAYGAAQAKIGLPVRVAGIIAALMQSGVDNVTVTSPAADIAAAAATAPILGAVTLTTSTDESAL
jgi:phage-related baseplate assembly protein